MAEFLFCIYSMMLIKGGKRFHKLFRAAGIGS